MRKMLGAILLMFSFTLVYAKDPIPEALLSAKTAVVENAGAEQKDVEKLREQLTKWGRFELVDSRAKADIAITLTREFKEQMVTGPGGRMQNFQAMINHMHIYKTEDGSELWADATSTYSKDPKALVSNLKHKLKNK